jgi:glycosyltransferase involved in cell wall biosynthesis
MRVGCKKISLILPNLGGGGAEKLAIYLANDWINRGFKVEFILMQNKGELLPLLSEHISVIEVGADRIRDLILPLRKYLKKSSPDVILVGMWPLTSAAVIAWLLAFRPGRIYLIEHCHLSEECFRGLHLSFSYVKAILRLTYPLATGIMAVSKGVKEDLCRLGRFQKESIQVIYNPAATGILPFRASKNDRQRLWGKGFTYHILSVGSFKIEKNHECLIRAFSKLPNTLNAKLTIVGEGNLRSKLEKLVADLALQDRVSLPGFSNDVYQWYRSADLFVLSSDSEGLPTVLIEALECGVPIVSTKCHGGPSEILDDGRYGILVSDGDVKELSMGIANALIKQHDRNALMMRAKDFSIEKISEKYLDYFKLPHHL